MNKKNIIIIILSVILVCAIGVVAYYALTGDKENPTTTSAVETSIASTDNCVVYPTDDITTEIPTEEAESTTEDKYPFIRNGAWYLVDKENEECFAFAFDKNNSADIAYFNSDNIEGLDAQYFSGDAKYEIEDDKIVFSNLPDEFGKKSITFEITGAAITFEGNKLKHFDKISLDNALKCFE